jgi:hypothetical protein
MPALRVIGVNPRVAEALGKPTLRSLAELPAGVDVVDVFRRSDAIPEIADELLALAPEKRPAVVWLQSGIRHDDAPRSSSRRLSRGAGPLPRRVHAPRPPPVGEAVAARLYCPVRPLDSGSLHVRDREERHAEATHLVSGCGRHDWVTWPAAQETYHWKCFNCEKEFDLHRGGKH